MKTLLMDFACALWDVGKTFLNIVLFLIVLSIVVFIVCIAFVPEMRELFVEFIRNWSAK